MTGTPRILEATDISEDTIGHFCASAEPDEYIGLAGAYGGCRKLEWLALRHSSDQLILGVPSSSTFEGGKKKGSCRTSPAVCFERGFAQARTTSKFIAFDADRLAAGLYSQCGVRLSSCIHVQSIITEEEEDLDSLSVISRLDYPKVPGQGGYNWARHNQMFDDRSKSDVRIEGLQFRSWAAMMLQHEYPEDIKATPAINSYKLSREVRLECYVAPK